jgi:signal peptidase I
MSPEIQSIALDLLRKGHAVRLKTQGQSMAPFIQEGDLITVRPLASSGGLRVGAVVVYWDDIVKMVVAHRIVKKESRAGRLGWVIRGDAEGWNGGDPFFLHEQIQGKVTQIQRDNSIAPVDKAWTSWSVSFYVRLYRLLSRLERKSPFSFHLSQVLVPRAASFQPLATDIPVTTKKVPPNIMQLSFRMSERILYRQAGPHSLVFPMHQGVVDLEQAFELNETGVYVWEKLNEQKSVGKIYEDILTTFHVAAEQAQNDLSQLLSDLFKLGAIIPV